MIAPHAIDALRDAIADTLELRTLVRLLYERLGALFAVDAVLVLRLAPAKDRAHVLVRCDASGLSEDPQEVVAVGRELEEDHRSRLHAAATQRSAYACPADAMAEATAQLRIPADGWILNVPFPDLDVGVLLWTRRETYGADHQAVLEALHSAIETALRTALRVTGLRLQRDALADENALFRDVTVALTAADDIGVGFQNALRRIAREVPLDYIALVHMDAATADQPTIALRVSHDTINWEPEALSLMGTALADSSVRLRVMEGLPDTFVAPLESSDIGKMLGPDARAQQLASAGLSPHSVVLLLGVKSLAASIIFVLEDPAAYRPQHMQVLELLKTPFVIALHNAVRFFRLEESRKRLEEENLAWQRDLQQEVGEHVVGMHQGLRHVMQLAATVAKTPSPVLLLGETGTGKEVIARAIHRMSERSSGPFIGINCGAIPESLIDSELFGHEKGAFTGAIERKLGRFERADKGTLFLDEVGELPLSAQVKLLRVLQEREFERVGGSTTIQADVRLIAATNRNLESMVREGRFREDLWFRLNVFPIEIPALRNRREDIPALAYYFLESKRRQLNLPYEPSLPPVELQRLIAYDWPGNVRELQNTIERALILSRGEPLRFDHLGASIRNSRPTLDPQPEQQIAVPTYREAVADYLRAALRAANGKIAGPGGAAALAGLPPSTFRSKMRKYGVRARRVVE